MAAPEQRLEDLRLLRVIALQAATHHVQGIDVRGRRLWLSSVDREARKGYLYLFDLSSGRLLRQVEVQDGERFHPGGISLDGNSIWIPVAEYRASSTASIQRRDARTLALRKSFVVEDHIGCVAAGRYGLMGGSWDSRQIYLWDRAGRLIAKKDNPTGNRHQDMKDYGGVIVASGVLSSEEGAIDWLDPETLRLQRRIVAGKTDHGVRYTNEGMAIRDGKLYLLPEDGLSRLFVFALP